MLSPETLVFWMYATDRLPPTELYASVYMQALKLYVDGMGWIGSLNAPLFLALLCGGNRNGIRKGQLPGGDNDMLGAETV